MYDVGLEFAPVLDALARDVVEDDLLFDGVDDFLELLDGLVVLPQVSQVARLLQVVPHVLDLALHATIRLLFFMIILSLYYPAVSSDYLE